MVDFEKLQEANKLIKTIKIQGKNYAEVKERIKAFRYCYPEGYIKTSIVEFTDEFVLIKAEIGIGEQILATGHAYEEKSSSRINQVSYIENCETSAVGRALSMLALGIESAVASAEEVRKASRASERQVALIIDIYNRTGGDLIDLMAEYKVRELDDLTSEQATEIITRLKGNGWKA